LHCIFSCRFCEARSGYHGGGTQALDAGDGAVHHASQFGGITGVPIFAQMLFRFIRGEPGGIAFKLLGRFETRDFAKVRIDDPRFRRHGFAGVARLAANVGGEAGHFDAAMNSGFFESLESGGLSMGEPRLGAALGEGPASAATSLDKQKFDPSAASAVADSGDLLASPQAAKMREADKFS